MTPNYVEKLRKTIGTNFHNDFSGFNSFRPGSSADEKCCSHFEMI